MYNVSPTNKTKIMTGKKKRIMALVADFAADKVLSSDGLLADDAAATIGALYNLVAASIEAMGQDSDGAVHTIKESMKAAATNVTGLVAENSAQGAEWDAFEAEFKQPDWTDSLTLCAWAQFNDGFGLALDIEHEYQTAFSAALSSEPSEEEDNTTNWNGYTAGFFGC